MHVDHVIDEDFLVIEDGLAVLTLVLDNDGHRRSLEERINTSDFGFGFTVFKEIGIDGVQELHFVLFFSNNKNKFSKKLETIIKGILVLTYTSLVLNSSKENNLSF